MITTALLLAAAPKIDPSWQVVFERQGDLYLSRADGKGLQKLARGGSWPRWSPDGKQVAFFRGEKLWTIDVRTHVEKALANTEPVEENAGFSIEWDPKRPVILFGSDSARGIGIVDLRSGKTGRILDRWTHWYTWGGRWSPSGRYLGFIRNGDVWLANRSAETMREPGSATEGDYYDAANRLAAIAVFNDVEHGASIATPYWVDDLAWTKDESKLVFHFQRQGGSGVSEIGFLDLKRNPKPSWDNVTAFKTTTRWILKDAHTPRLCPDGQTLSYVSLGENGGLYVCSWEGRSKKFVMRDVANPDWRPVKAGSGSR